MFVQSITIICVHSNKDVNWICVKKQKCQKNIKINLLFKSVFISQNDVFFVSRKAQNNISYHQELKNEK